MSTIILPKIDLLYSKGYYILTPHYLKGIKLTKIENEKKV